MSAAPTGRPPEDPIAKATRIQREVADPRVSATVRAGAGSGKTHVLVSRIVRLCLAGADPAAIVAVTFTKKAAVEIKARLLKELRALAVMAAPARREALRALLAREPEPAELDRAATLYDRFLEDLPGLPIGTIHAWCQRLLGRFPADLGLDPSFEVAEKPEDLWEEALDRLEAQTVSDPVQRAELAGLATSPPRVRQTLTGFFTDRLALDRWLGRLADVCGVSALDVERSSFHAAMVEDLQRTLFLGTSLEGRTDPRPADLAPALIAAAERFAEVARGPLATLAPKAVTPSARTQLDGFIGAPAHARAFAAAADDADDGALAAATADLRRLLLTQGDKLRALKGGRAGKEERDAVYVPAARVVLEALVLSDLLVLCRRNDRLLRFGLAALDIYERLKKRDRVIDFHDLERLARHLVTRSAQKEWIQYRLDAVTEHLLVDEFQDTNHNQWDVLRPIAEEFLAGEGAHDTPPTVFVVGDVKQSIYRFRGADPGLFAEVAQRMEATGEESGVRIESLPTNFRSVPAIVDTVGRLFTAPPLVDLLPQGEAAHARQYPNRAAGPSDEVFVIPPFEGDRNNDDTNADLVDQAAHAAARIVLHLRAEATVIDKETGQPRPLTWGDILVLCRSRTHIGAYEEALRRVGVPIVPSGRGSLARSREVQDLLLLLRWLAFPDDDPALASVLRSPLFRISEAELQRALALRHGRRGGRRYRRPLWIVLRTRADRIGLEEARDTLTEWRRRAGVEGCHDLLRRIYRDVDAPERFAAALGEQARWNLLRLHDLALALDLGPHPSLRRFADLIARAAETSGEEEATVPEQGDGRVRVMTVHAAKGLEAPAVLFVDAARPLRRGETRVPLAPGDSASPILYGLTKPLRDGPELPPGELPIRPGALKAALEAADRATENEDADILYVAMTRARDRLYVLGSRGANNSSRPDYFTWLQQAANAVGADADPLPARFERPDWLDAAPPPVGRASDAARAAVATDIRTWTPPSLAERVKLQSPSALAAPGTDTAFDAGPTARADTFLDALLDAPGRDGVVPAATAAAARGTAIHLRLRMAAEPGGLPPDDATFPLTSFADPLAEARAVATNPGFAWIFHPEETGGRGWSETGVIHERPPATAGGAPQRVFGAIDRLVRRGNRVDIIDYKSNRLEGNAGRIAAEIRRLTAHYAPQLAAYRAAVAELFPGHEIAASLLFTHARDAADNQGLLVSVTSASPN
jgi:ATP-dependent helicase/nuclease subunit A